MAAVVGALIVICSVVIGYLAIGGNPEVLCQPAVFLIVAGSAIGAWLTAGGFKGAKGVCRALSSSLRTGRYDKHRYLDGLTLMHDIFKYTRKEGVLALEKHIESPQTSALFLALPSVSADRQAVEFITDYIRLIIGGNFDAMQLETLMEADIVSYHEQAEAPAAALAKMADSLPAFGIAAAVMGVGVTMGALNGPTGTLGESVGAALVGIFLGVVLAYGFVGPLSNLVEVRAREAAKFLEVIKVALIASLNGYDPATATEFGRKVVYADDRPSFEELHSHLRQKRGEP
jgi:chemotaxis protein MotA